VYAIDCSAINRVVQDNTARMSAYRLQEIKKKKASSSAFRSASLHQLTIAGLNQTNSETRKISAQSYNSLKRDSSLAAARQRHSVPARYGSVSQLQSLPGQVGQGGAGGALIQEGDQEIEDDHSHRL